MSSIVIALAVLVTSGCVYDTSSKALEGIPPDASVAVNPDATETPTCSAGASCGGCGVEVCVETAVGVRLQCQPAANGDDLCGQGRICDGEARCEDAPTMGCTPSERKLCDGCRSQKCLDSGQWSQCQADDAVCLSGQSCLELDGDFECVASCSTIGRRDSCDGEEVPLRVPVGSNWKTADGCFSDECRRCSCESSGNGPPKVRCDYDCDD